MENQTTGLDRIGLLRYSKSVFHAAMSVNGQHPSLRKGKWKKLYMNLPGTGEVELLISFKKNVYREIINHQVPVFEIESLPTKNDFLLQITVY